MRKQIIILFILSLAVTSCAGTQTARKSDATTRVVKMIGRSSCH